MDLANVRKWDQSSEDMSDPFWVDEVRRYAFNCDGGEFGTKPRNRVFNQLHGERLENLKALT